MQVGLIFINAYILEWNNLNWDIILVNIFGFEYRACVVMRLRISCLARLREIDKH